MKQGLKFIAWYKGITGALALILVLSILIYGRVRINDLISKTYSFEFQEDPKDVFLNWVAPFPHINASSTYWIFLTAMTFYGITHLIIAYEISKGRYWSIVFVFWILLVFLSIELISIIHRLKLSKIVVFIVNVAIVIYLYNYIKKYHNSFNLFKHLKEIFT